MNTAAKTYGGYPAALLVQTITRLMAANPGIRRTPLSRLVCEALHWRGVDGRPSEMSCRVAMLRLAAAGLVTLPASQIPHPRRRARFEATERTDAQAPIDQPVHELAAPRFEIIQGRGEASRCWNEFMARYHYLGYAALSGHQMRYGVHVAGQLVALLAFGAGTWKLACRDRFIGWSPVQRERNLHRVINNTRFLILPWVRSQGLASKVLALAARRLPRDWFERYGFRPLLLETFVETPRYVGTCYKAANWQCVGQTTGRGKLSRTHQPTLPVKDIWIYPLQRHFRDILCK